MADNPHLQDLPAELQYLLSPAEFKVFLFNQFRHRLECLTTDFEHFLSSCFSDSSIITMIIMAASDSRTPDEAKSNIAALIAQSFFTLIDPKSNEKNLFGTVPSLSVAPDESTSLESGNQTSTSSPRDSDRVPDSDRPTFTRSIKHALAVKDRKFLPSKHIVFVML